MVGRTESRTQADKRRGEIIREIGCICCAIEGWPDVPCEEHHLLDGYRLGHEFTIGLDTWHHRGEVAPIFRGNIERMTHAHGPSLQHNPRLFHERYGTDEELLMVQDSAIRIVESARRRNEYLPLAEIARLVRIIHDEIVQGETPNPRAVCG